MDRLTRKSQNSEMVWFIDHDNNGLNLEPCEMSYSNNGKAIRKLAEYENTGLTPQDIEQMKARMPLHQWAGESPDKMSIFGVTVSKIMELAKAEKEGRLVVLTVRDIHPCRNCDTGWGSISSEGCHSCEETCVRLKEYNEKINEKYQLETRLSGAVMDPNLAALDCSHLTEEHLNAIIAEMHEIYD